MKSNWVMAFHLIMKAHTTEEIAGAAPLMLDKDSGEMKDQTGNVVATAKV